MPVVVPNRREKIAVRLLRHPGFARYLMAKDVGVQRIGMTLFEAVGGDDSARHRRALAHAEQPGPRRASGHWRTADGDELRHRLRRSRRVAVVLVLTVLVLRIPVGVGRATALGHGIDQHEGV